MLVKLATLVEWLLLLNTLQHCPLTVLRANRACVPGNVYCFKSFHYRTGSCTEHAHTCKQLCTLAFWFSFSLSFTISSLAVTRSCDVCSCTGWHTESIGLVLLRADLVVREEDEVCDKEVSGRRCVVESCCCCCCNTSCDLLTWRHGEQKPLVIPLLEKFNTVI